jgi:hypothetical protein
LKISVGLDTNRNNWLDLAEVSQTTFLCNTVQIPSPSGLIDNTFGTAGTVTVGTSGAFGADYIKIASNGDILTATKAVPGYEYHQFSRFTSQGSLISRIDRNKALGLYLTDIGESATAGFVYSTHGSVAGALKRLASTSSQSDLSVILSPSEVPNARLSPYGPIQQIVFVNNEGAPTILGRADYPNVGTKNFIFGNNWNHRFDYDGTVTKVMAAGTGVVYCSDDSNHSNFRIRKLQKNSNGAIIESTLLDANMILQKFPSNPGELYCFDNVDATSYHGSYLLVGGYNSKRLIVAFDGNGDLDLSFGSLGVLDPVTISGQYNLLDIQADGKILAGIRGGFEGTIKRIDRRGIIDSQFGTNGEIAIFGLKEFTLSTDQKIIYSAGGQIGRLK